MRPALVLGFGLTIGMWFCAYWYFSTQITALEARQSRLSGNYQLAQDLLTSARTEMLSSAVASRQVLLDNAPENAEGYLRLVEDAFRKIDVNLDQYERLFPTEPALNSPKQREELVAVRTQVAALMATTRAVLDERPDLSRAGRILTNDITPKRETSMAAAEALLKSNRENLFSEQTRVSSEYKVVQQRILEALGVALLTSLGVVVVLSRHAGRLESRVREQRVRDLDNASNLQRLTARLVTAQEEERRHIARELHDEVGQVFTVVKFALRDAQKAVIASGGSAEALEEARIVSDRALQTVRDLSRLLHPSILDDMGLSVAIDAHLQGFGRRENIEVSAEYVNMDERLSPDLELVLYRTVQEALTNVARHAHATACRVQLRRAGDCVDVTVEDNGIGFDAEAASQPGPRRGLGLLGMQERITQIGGEMVLESVSGRGTRVFASLPVGSTATQAETLELGAPLAASATEGTHA